MCNVNSKKLCQNADCDVCFQRSFASHPKSTYWSETNSLTPREVFKSSGKHYAFYCNVCKHTFSSKLSNVTCLNKWCPYCSDPPKKLCTNDDCMQCFEKSFASHSKSIHWSKTNITTPRQVFKASHAKFTFKCGVCNHDFQTNIANIVYNNQWCPFCSNQSLCSNEECTDCFNKSFASHPMAALWSENNTITPRNIFKASSCVKIEFKCNTCSHYFKKILNSVTTNNTGCPYCSNITLCKSIDCMKCFNNSFASHPMSICWSTNNKQRPRDVFAVSAKKYEFVCKTCNHLFISSLSNIKNQTHCPYCSHKTLCNSSSCDYCFNNSFASHEKSIYSTANNKVSPRHIFKYSNADYEFMCNTCNHTFVSKLNNVTSSNAQWCPHCVRKTELKLYEWLLLLFSNVVREQSFDWCRNPSTNCCYRYDFHLPNHRILIELDGDQHFHDVWNWNCHIKTQTTDVYKMKLAVANGYNVIRIRQIDVWKNLIDWKMQLTSTIQMLVQTYNTTCTINPHCTVVYICNNNEYKEHQELFFNTTEFDCSNLEDEKNYEDPEDQLCDEMEIVNNDKIINVEENTNI